MSDVNDQDTAPTVKTPRGVVDPRATEVLSGTESPVGHRGEHPSIPGYCIIERVGAGGMGEVWKAEQQSTRRVVALKLLHTHDVRSEDMFERFEREVELAARLEHPNITRVYESGSLESSGYYAMEFVDGVPLDEYAQVHALVQDDILRVMGEVCGAVQYAHQNGVIHRDLKPRNILVDDEGKPHVLDFGLAKALDEERAASILSMEGDVLGTPAFMAPEQARGDIRQTDTRTDVYSLGVILFNLLTGEFPHDVSGNTYDVIRRVGGEEPRRPREFLPTIDRDVEAILLKALAREPDRRYTTAGALADDIRAYLDGNPVTAQAPTLRYFLAKGLRKHRAAVAGVAALLAVAAVGTVCYIVSIKAEQARTHQQKLRADDMTREAQANAEQATANAEKAAANAETARVNEGKAKARAEELRRALYFSRIAQANTAWNDGDPVRVDEYLDKCPVDLRHWEWSYLKRLTTHMQPRRVRHHVGPVVAGAVSPDGRWMASVARGGEVTLQDTSRLRTSRLVARIEAPRTGRFLCAPEFTPDSSLLATGDAIGSIQLWEVESGAERLAIRAHEGHITGLDFTPDGRRLASSGLDGTVRLWDIRDGTQTLIIKDFKSFGNDLAVTPDGREVVTADGPGNSPVAMRAWNAETGELLRSWGHSPPGGNGYRCVDVSPDGTRVAAGHDTGVRVWELATGRLLAGFERLIGTAYCVAFLPDGKRIVCSGEDVIVRVLDVDASRQVLRLQNAGRLAVPLPDGTGFACFDLNRGVRLWPLPSGSHCIRSGGVPTFSHSGNELATVQGRSQVFVHDIIHWLPLAAVSCDGKGVRALAFSPDDKSLAMGGVDTKHARRVLHSALMANVLSPREEERASGSGMRIRAPVFSSYPVRPSVVPYL